MIRRFVGLALALVAWGLDAVASEEGASPVARPNIVLIIADDMAWDDCGAYGNKSIQTPNLDRLAREGMRFDRAFLACSSCSPSRSSLITGRYPHSTGAEQLHWPLPADEVTFVELLRARGYYTAAAGKWHLGAATKSKFDVVKEGGGPSGCTNWVNLIENRPKDVPCFLWLAAIDPHRPYQPDTIERPHTPQDAAIPPYLPDVPDVREDFAQYYDEVTRLDGFVGQVLDALDREGMRDNTIVLFMSDNGRAFPRCKTTVFDSGIRTPFIVRWPAKIDAGSTCNSLVSSVDIAPTLLEIVGAESSPTFQGQSFARLFADPQAVTRQYVHAEHNWHDYGDHQRAVRSAQFKYIRNYFTDIPLTPPADAVRSPTFQAMRRLRDAGTLRPEQTQCFTTPRAAEELYDLDADPHELRNVAGESEYAESLAEHRAELARWEKATGDRVPEPRPADEYDRETGEALPNRSMKREPRRPPVDSSKSSRQPQQARTNLRPRSASSPQSAATPNVILIISDDQAWTDYSFMGHEQIRTPHLDKLASQSRVFPRGYVTAPLCCPSLASIITGLYPHQHKITCNDPPTPEGTKRGDPAWQQAFRRGREVMNRHLEAVPTLPRLLGERGYLSLQTGKWWQGDFRRGGFTHGMTRGDRHGDDGLTIGRKSMQPIYDFIQHAGSEQKPFFVWYAPLLPHDPHTPPQRLLDKYKDKTESIHIARYWAMVEWFDETCGELLDYLDREKLANDTIVVYVTDNGWIQRPDRATFAEKSKRSPYDGGVRTPIMIRWPGKIQPSMRDDLVSSIDLASTLLTALGLPTSREMQGINLLDDAALKQRQRIYGESFVHTAVDLDHPAKNLESRWIVEGRWKLIAPAGKPAASELYDIVADPRENQNVADQHADTVARLLRQLDDWWDPGL